MIRLFDIAYVSRHSLPLLLSVAFMLADVHFRVELEVRFEARFLQNENREDRQRHLNNFNHFFFCLIFLQFNSFTRWLEYGVLFCLLRDWKECLIFVL